MLWEHKWLYIELRPNISLNLILKMDATTQPKNFDKLSALNDRTRQNVNWFVYLVTRYKKVIQLIQICRRTVYPKKYAHGFVVLCFVVVTQSFIMNSHEVFIHIHQGCFAGTGAIVRLPQCQWSKPDGYGKISQCMTTTKHSKAKTVCIFLGTYCTSHQNWENMQQRGVNLRF